jgi:hypothetical protein
MSDERNEPRRLRVWRAADSHDTLSGREDPDLYGVNVGD